MSAPSMMSSAWSCSVARGARQLRVLVRDLQQIAHDGAALRCGRRSRARWPRARCSFSIVASRISPNASRATTTAKCERGGEGKRQSRESRDSRCARTDPRSDGRRRGRARAAPVRRRAVQNSVPQRKPRPAGAIGASTGTGSSAGSVSGVTCTVPRAGRLGSSGRSRPRRDRRA